MHRRVLHGVLPVVAMVLAGVVGQAPATTARTTPAQAAAGGGAPLVNVAAFRGQGRLAFLWNDRPYVLDGQRGTLRLLPGSGVAHLAWSGDGRWLAYLTDAGNSGAGRLWVSRADGGLAHKVQGLPAVTAFAWSPRGDVLAARSEPSPGGAGGLWVVPATGGVPRNLAPGLAWVGSIAWAPDGRLAVQTGDPRQRGADLLEVVSLTGRRPVVLARTRIVHGQDSGMIVAGWWPDGRGLLHQLDPYHSASIAADGLPLWSLPAGGTARRLVTTLGYPDWLSSWGREVVVVAGLGRQSWDTKSLAICNLRTASCRPVPQPSGVVSLDPAWAPDGMHIAFVRAQALGPLGGLGSPAALRAWVASRTLWILNTGSGLVDELPHAGRGIYAPQWSADGRHMLYVRDNALWLIATAGGAPARIVGPFPQVPDLFGYYGHVTWSGLYAWDHHDGGGKH